MPYLFPWSSQRDNPESTREGLQIVGLPAQEVCFTIALMKDHDAPTSVSNIARLKTELDKLIKKGELLRIALVVDLKKFDPDDMEKIKEIKLPSFKGDYET
jgi:hypothetical protein